MSRVTQNISNKIDLYKEEIIIRNYKNFKSFAFGGMILTGGITLVALICYGHVYFTREYAVLFSLFVLYNLYIHFFLKKHIKYTIQSFYAAMAPILVVGILMGTFLDSESNAMTIMIMLCTLFVFITDKPLHILGCIFMASVVFLLCSYLCKPMELFISDLVNLIIYLSVGIGVNMLTLNDRIQSAENYVLAIQRGNHDALTSILNRGAGDSLVKQLLKSGQKGTFIIADIDDFKIINDTYGHQIGDNVIREVSQQLKKVFRDEDIVWRLGGDEFAIYAANLLDKGICELRMKQVQQLASTIALPDHTPLNIKLSMGVSICGTQNYEFDDIYKSSDDALYEAKQQGKNKYVIHELAKSKSIASENNSSSNFVPLH